MPNLKHDLDQFDEGQRDCTSLHGPRGRVCFEAGSIRVNHPPAEPAKSDARRDEGDNVQRTGSGERERISNNIMQGTRRYFRRPESVISLLTLVAVIVYTSLTYFLLDAERESYRRVQRAFVFPAEYVFRIEKPAHMISINVVWKNGGDTPTRNLHISTTMGRRVAPLPSDFDFPSDDRKMYSGRPLPVLVLGPHASASAIRPVEIPFDAVPDINGGRELVYLWGYARYHDVFGSPHLTRYCVQITSIETDIGGNTSNVTGTDIPCDRGNCADEECQAEKIPLPR